MSQNWKIRALINKAGEGFDVVVGSCGLLLFLFWFDAGFRIGGEVDVASISANRASSEFWEVSLGAIQSGEFKMCSLIRFKGKELMYR